MLVKIHNIASLEITLATNVLDQGHRHWYRQLRITDVDGHVVDLQLFAADRKALAMKKPGA